MSLEQLTQSQREQLNAYLDGELSAEQAQQVAARLAEDPTWASAAGELRQLDRLLDQWTVPPLRRDLSDSIVAKAQHRRGVPAWVQILTPLAAAAAIVLAVYVSQRVASDRPAAPTAPGQAYNAEIEQVLSEVEPDDRLAVEHLDMLQEYQVLASFETIQAMERIEQSEGGL